jgi:hypothetical protein
MNETWIEKIKYAYWGIVPHDWRPGQIWYRFKCWAWHRYTTVKPRYLDHTYCDRTMVMPHMMFEILCQFVEQECSPGCVEWYGEWSHKVAVDGEEKFVMDEMKELVEWWHTVWNKEVKEVEDMLWAEAERHQHTDEHTPVEGKDLFEGVSLYEWEQHFATEEDKAIYNRCVMGCNNLDRIMHKALEARLQRIIPLIPSMWT